jgi:hypothetical protein
MAESPSDRPADSAEQIKDIVAAYWGGSTADVRPTPPLSEREQLQNEDLRQTIELRKMYAKRVLWGLFIQVLIADIVFILYARQGVNWDIPESTMDVWLGATVVQIVSIVLIVTRHLFPGQDQKGQ